MKPSDKKSIHAQVMIGLGSIPESTTTEVSVRDLMFTFQLLQELHQFFHQPLHYPADPNVIRYMHKQGGDALSLIHEAVYERVRNMLPKQVVERIHNGEFESGLVPYYFAENEIVHPKE